MKVLVVGRFELERLGVTSMLRSLLAEDADIGHAQNDQEMLSSIKQELGFDMLVVDAKVVGKSGVDCGFNPSMQRIDESAQPVYQSLVFFADAH